MKKLCPVVLASLPLMDVVQASEPDWFIDSRIRYESVSQDNGLSDADALTLRLRAGLTWSWSDDWTFLADAEAILDVAGDYNNTTNGEGAYSVVADPDGEELNRVQLTYKGFDKTAVTLGRQRLKFDNDRFIGNVGWRQNEQTFDGLMITNTAIKDTVIKAGYLGKAHRIFGDDSPNGNWDLSSPVVNVSYTGISNSKLVVYGYFFEFDDIPLASQRTIGARFDRTTTTGTIAWKYGVELASQKPYRNGNSINDASYRRLELSAKVNGVTVGVGNELLSGDGTYGFQTPFATAHAFNGWSDLFLRTPDNGLNDNYVWMNTALGKTRVLLRHHWFDSDSGSLEYGSEIEGIVTRPLREGMSAGLKFSSYSENGFGVDTDKLWLFLNASW